MMRPFHTFVKQAEGMEVDASIVDLNGTKKVHAAG
jgi:hypothetical protein